MPATSCCGHQLSYLLPRLILIKGGTLAFQKHYVNLNHYDTNICSFSHFYATHRDGHLPDGAWPRRLYMLHTARES